MLAYLEQERRTEEDREAFISSEYWNLLESREKRNVKRTLIPNVNARTTEFKLATVLSTVVRRGTGQVAGAADVGIFGLENLATSPLKTSIKNFWSVIIENL